MKYFTLFFTLLFLQYSHFLPATSGEDIEKQSVSCTQSKIDILNLIQSEVAYARYINWLCQMELIPLNDGLDWIESILFTVDYQLEELIEGSPSLESLE